VVISDPAHDGPLVETGLRGGLLMCESCQGQFVRNTLGLGAPTLSTTMSPSDRAGILQAGLQEGQAVNPFQEIKLLSAGEATENN
jgi:hypothetical protein